MTTYNVFGHYHNYPQRLGKATIRLSDSGLTVERVVYRRICMECRGHGDDYASISGKEVRVFGWGTDDVYVKFVPKLPQGVKNGSWKDESKLEFGESVPSDGASSGSSNVERRAGSHDELRNRDSETVPLRNDVSTGAIRALRELYNELDEAQVAVYQAVSSGSLSETHSAARKVVAIAEKIAALALEEGPLQRTNAL